MATKRKVTLADVEAPSAPPSLRGPSGRSFARYVPIQRQRFRPDRELFDFASLSPTIARAAEGFAEMMQSDREDREVIQLQSELEEGDAAFEVEIERDDPEGPIPSTDGPPQVYGPAEDSGEQLKLRSNGADLKFVTAPPLLTPPSLTRTKKQQEVRERIRDAAATKGLPPLANPLIREADTLAAGFTVLTAANERLKHGVQPASEWVVDPMDGHLGGPRVNFDAWAKQVWQESKARWAFLDREKPEFSRTAHQVFVRGFHKAVNDAKLQVNEALNAHRLTQSKEKVFTPAYVEAMLHAVDPEQKVIDANPTRDGREAHLLMASKSIERMVEVYRQTGSLVSGDRRQGVPSLTDTVLDAMEATVRKVARTKKNHPFDRRETLLDMQEVFDNQKIGGVPMEKDDRYQRRIGGLIAQLLEQSESAVSGASPVELDALLAREATKGVAILQGTFRDNVQANNAADLARAKNEARKGLDAYMAENEIGEDSPDGQRIAQRFEVWWNQQVSTWSEARVGQASAVAAEMATRMQLGEDPGAILTEARAALAANRMDVDTYRRLEKSAEGMIEGKQFTQQGTAFAAEMSEIDGLSSDLKGLRLSPVETRAMQKTIDRVKIRYRKAFDAARQAARAAGEDEEKAADEFVTGGAGEAILNEARELAASTFGRVREASSDVRNWNRQYHRMSESEYRDLEAQVGVTEAQRLRAENHDRTDLGRLHAAFSFQVAAAQSAVEGEIQRVATVMGGGQEGEASVRDSLQPLFKQAMSRRVTDIFRTLRDGHSQDFGSDVATALQEATAEVVADVEKQAKEQELDRQESQNRIAFESAIDVLDEHVSDSKVYRTATSTFLDQVTSPELRAFLPRDEFAALMEATRFTPASQMSGTTLRFGLPAQPGVTIRGALQQRLISAADAAKAQIAASAMSPEQKAKATTELDHMVFGVSAREVIDGQHDGVTFRPHQTRFVSSEKELQALINGSGFPSFLEKVGIETPRERKLWIANQRDVLRLWRGKGPHPDLPVGSFDLQQQGPQPAPDTGRAPAPRQPEAFPKGGEQGPPTVQQAEKAALDIEKALDEYKAFLKRTFPDDLGRQKAMLDRMTKRLKGGE